jgi:hypothetical protein
MAPLVAVAAAGGLGFAECKAIGAAAALGGLGVAVMGSDPGQDSERAPTGGESRDGAGVDVVDGLHRA